MLLLLCLLAVVAFGLHFGFDVAKSGLLGTIFATLALVAAISNRSQR